MPFGVIWYNINKWNWLELNILRKWISIRKLYIDHHGQRQCPDRTLSLPPSSSSFRPCGHYYPPDCFYHLYKSLLAQTQCNEQTCKAVNLWLSPPSRERTVGYENKEGWGETDRDVERERIKKRQESVIHTPTANTHSVSSAVSPQFRNYILLSSLTLRKEESLWSVWDWCPFKLKFLAPQLSQPFL